MPYNSQTSRSDANALIPIETSKQIIQELPKQSIALSLFRQMAMSSKTLRQPVLDVLPDAYFVAGDTGLKQTSSASWANRELVAEEIAVVVPIAEAVLEDSQIDIWEQIKPRIVEKIGARIDQAVFFGTNKPSTWGESVVGHADAAGNEIVRGAVVDQDLAGDISATMAMVEADGYQVDGFVTKVGMKHALRNLRDDEGRFLFQTSMVAGTPDNLFGEPLHYMENGGFVNASADMIAIHRAGGIIGLRQDITFKKFTEGVVTDETGAIMYNLMQQDMVALRVVMRIAWQVANPGTSLNSNSSTRSPFAVLRPTGWS